MELNKVLLVGRLGRDPELKYMPSGDAVADFSIALSHKYKDRQGEMKEETTWVKITCFGKQAEFASNYLQKGKAVFVEGRLRENKWETQEGQKRSQLEVVAERLQFAFPRGSEEGGGAPMERHEPSSPRHEPAAAAPAAPAVASESNTVDDLPF